ncbi:uncharacterized protein Z518_01902 [Rhinocladiella mackenziei CBS 650.93]|uniref:Uncharacterized protein n=1 Tax=Rhinocladiella mackenziei CBS 650.93 TaxID=1442369 RepID=A0A0D2IN46_9EURO|nr:uncharacterized protein Z518_01902 [Rhinocladiella mackenziei CBS 650.93]KIX07249.1 hypothetical protein Z518_01902 [Rhinocladiella mackenziei CBS 650.93]
MSQSPHTSSGGPYPSTTAGMGGVPTATTDIPICAVFLFLYIGFAVTNTAIFQLNRRKHHKFVLSALLFGFCMARIATLVLRIAWATRQHNIRLGVAAQIFVNAGVLIIYIINLILAQRILRAKQPRIGWNSVLRASYKIVYIGIGAALAMVITAVVVSIYTLNSHTKSTCRDVQLAALTYLLIFTCLPLIHVAMAVLLPRSKDEETFGQGSMRSKIIIVTLSTCLCMLIAGFKAGGTWSPPRPLDRAAWYDSKACFYIFNFTCEILILSVLTFSRIDKKFFVPDGCRKAGDYSRLGREQGNPMEIEDNSASMSGCNDSKT